MSHCALAEYLSVKVTVQSWINSYQRLRTKVHPSSQWTVFHPQSEALRSHNNAVLKTLLHETRNQVNGNGATEQIAADGKRPSAISQATQINYLNLEKDSMSTTAERAVIQGLMSRAV